VYQTKEQASVLALPFCLCCCCAVFPLTRPTGNWSPARAERDCDLPPAFLPRPPLPPDLPAPDMIERKLKERREERTARGNRNEHEPPFQHKRTNFTKEAAQSQSRLNSNPSRLQNNRTRTTTSNMRFLTVPYCDFLFLVLGAGHGFRQRAGVAGLSARSLSLPLLHGCLLPSPLSLSLFLSLSVSSVVRRCPACWPLLPWPGRGPGPSKEQPTAARMCRGFVGRATQQSDLRLCCRLLPSGLRSLGRRRQQAERTGPPARRQQLYSPDSGQPRLAALRVAAAPGEELTVAGGWHRQCRCGRGKGKEARSSRVAGAQGANRAAAPVTFTSGTCNRGASDKEQQ
jgi:hypothetical protein